MAPRQIKMPAKNHAEQEVEEVFSQSKRPERGRYLLQVDRQTKNSYTTSEAAQSAAWLSRRVIRSFRCPCMTALSTRIQSYKYRPHHPDERPSGTGYN
jgi:hypothetical protein